MQGVHPVTAYRWFREGKLPVPARKVGRLILVEPVEEALERARICRRRNAQDQLMGWSSAGLGNRQRSHTPRCITGDMNR